MQEQITSNSDYQSFPSKKNSFQTQNSVITSSLRKKYFLKVKRLNNQSHANNSISKSNIFDLTAQNNYQNHSQISNNYNTISQSRFYSNSIISSPSKQKYIENPQKIIQLPIITESKYNFKPSVILPKVIKQKWHNKDPLYVQDETNIDQRNIKKMKKYQKFWNNKSSSRNNASLLDRSVQKAQKFIEKHNSELMCRKASISFQTILRDRHIQQANRFGIAKGVPCRSLPGLKGKGGSVRSLFQQVFAVEQVYKFDK